MCFVKLSIPYRVVTLKTTFLANGFILNLDVEMAGSVSLISLNSFFMLFSVWSLYLTLFCVGENVTIKICFAKLLLSFLSKISKFT